MSRPDRLQRRTSPAGPAPRPLYARVLRLRYLRPGWLLCFVFFEGMITLGVLLALAELVSWWAVLVLPAAVAVMVKLNDMVARALVVGSPQQRSSRASHRRYR